MMRSLPDFLNERLGHAELIDSSADHLECAIERFALLRDGPFDSSTSRARCMPPLKIESALERNTPHGIVDETVWTFDTLLYVARKKRRCRGEDQSCDN